MDSSVLSATQKHHFSTKMSVAQLGQLQSYVKNYNRALGATAADNKQMGVNGFLKLLVAEMSHQDPSSPMDSSKMVSEFSQLSSVQQSLNLNKNLDHLSHSMLCSQALGLLGKTVSIHNAGQVLEGKVESVSTGKNVQIKVLGQSFPLDAVKNVLTMENAPKTTDKTSNEQDTFTAQSHLSTPSVPSRS